MQQRAVERINYLALAMEARKAMKDLKAFARTKEVSPQLTTALRGAVNSVKALASPGKLYSELHNEGGYDRSEAIQTLTEVADQLQGENFLTKLESVLAGKGSPDDFQSAIRFFSAIEKKALYYYDDPSLAETG
jgi:hypothetical protein